MHILQIQINKSINANWKSVEDILKDKFTVFKDLENKNLTLFCFLLQYWIKNCKRIPTLNETQ